MVTAVNQTNVSPIAIESFPDSIASQQDLAEINFHALGFDDEIAQYTLRDAYQAFALDMQGDIPFLIWLLENPKSALALPGKVDLLGHDCIHVLLNRGKTNFDEAFVIGFTMGNDSLTREHHVKIFRTFATRLYPPKFRFSKYHMKSFDLGFKYGQSLNHKDINRINFKLYMETHIQTLRNSLGICLEDLKETCAHERLWMQMAAAFS